MRWIDVGMVASLGAVVMSGCAEEPPPPSSGLCTGSLAGLSVDAEIDEESGFEMHELLGQEVALITLSFGDGLVVVAGTLPVAKDGPDGDIAYDEEAELSTEVDPPFVDPIDLSASADLELSRSGSGRWMRIRGEVILDAGAEARCSFDLMRLYPDPETESDGDGDGNGGGGGGGGGGFD